MADDCEGKLHTHSILSLYASLVFWGFLQLKNRGKMLVNRKLGKLTALSAFGLGVFFIVPMAFADLQSTLVERNAQQPLKANVSLSRDVYRTESYEDDYTVDVPYDEQETYTEQVPYQDTETYIDQEPYQETQNVCRDESYNDRECHDEQVCQDVPKQDCHDEQRCEDVPHQDCHDEQRCEDVPHQDCHNEQRCEDVPHQECENHEVCHGEGDRRDCHQEQHCENRSERNCHDENRCENRSERQCHNESRCENRSEHQCHNESRCENHSERECHNESKCVDIPRSRHECHDETVTKYRDVTKTREVTRYRDEQRTRTVTKYRQETRCCVTRNRDVFDHQYLAKLEVNFPVEAALDADEKESFLATLSGSDADAKISFAPKNVIYGYGPADIQKRAIDQFEINMHLVPKYKATELGHDSITKVAVTTLMNAPKFIMNDTGAVKKVTNTYSLQILDPASGAILAQLQKAGSASAAISWDLPALPAALATVHVKLSVAREGIVLTAPIQFLWEGNVPVKKEQPYDPKPYLNKDLVNNAGLTGKTVALALTFRDQTKAIPEVLTEYHVKLTLVDRVSKTLAETTFKRESLTMKSDGTVSLVLAKDLGVSVADLKTLVTGKVVALELSVLRYGTRFTPSPSTVLVKGQLKVK